MAKSFGYEFPEPQHEGLTVSPCLMPVFVQVKVSVTAPEEGPMMAGYCHCSDCRRVFGAPVNMLAMLSVEQVNIIQVCVQAR